MEKKLTPDELQKTINAQTKGLKGEKLVSKVLEMCDVYGESAIYYVNADEYLQEGDASVKALPYTTEDMRMGFNIEHTFIREEENLNCEYAYRREVRCTYICEEELFIFPRLPIYEQEKINNREKQLVMDTEHARVFITDGPHTSRYFYSPGDEETKDATVTLDLNSKTITISINGYILDNYAKITKTAAESLWGHDGYRGNPAYGDVESPKGKKMGAEDLVLAAMKTEEAIEPALTMDRIEDLNEMGAALTLAVNKEIKERGLALKEIHMVQPLTNR